MVSSIPAIYDPRAMPRGRSTYNQKEPDPGTFGYCLFQRRWRQLGLTQQELADRIVELGGRMKQGDISDLESGKVGEPRRPRMRLIAQALRVPVETLYLWRDHPEAGAVVTREIAEDAITYDSLRRELIDETNDFTPQELARLKELAKRMRETREPHATKPTPKRNS